MENFWFERKGEAVSGFDWMISGYIEVGLAWSWEAIFDVVDLQRERERKRDRMVI